MNITDGPEKSSLSTGRHTNLVKKNMFCKSQITDIDILEEETADCKKLFDVYIKIKEQSSIALRTNFRVR
jgi:hypothetical protein